MQNDTFQQKQITTEINRAINQGFSIDTHEDAELLINQNYSWDDLNKFKEELGNSVLQFVYQVNEIITSPNVINNLGEHKEHFSKLVNVFFTDINEFSNRVMSLRVQHEHLTGPIKDLNEYNLYNRIAINYHSLYTELSALVTPTLSELVMTISDVANIPVEQQQTNNQE